MLSYLSSTVSISPLTPISSVKKAAEIQRMVDKINKDNEEFAQILFFGN